MDERAVARELCVALLRAVWDIVTRSKQAVSLPDACEWVDCAVNLLKDSSGCSQSHPNIENLLYDFSQAIPARWFAEAAALQISEISATKNDNQQHRIRT